MNRRSIFKTLKDWFWPDIHTKVAKAKKSLANLERLLPLPDPPLTQRWILDSFFCHVADTLSFGEESPSLVVAHMPYTGELNLREFAYTRDPFGMLAEVVAPLIHMRHDLRHQGKKVVAMRVVWINVPHRDHNPFSEIGFFAARLYAEKTPYSPSLLDLSKDQLHRTFDP